MANPEHAEFVKLVADYAIASMDLGINKFREFVIDFKETFGETNTRELATAVEEAWGLLPEFGYEVDSAGKVADVLGPETGVTDGDNNEAGTTGRSETPPDTSMGGMLGESGRTLAPKAGERAADGKTNLRSGPPISHEMSRAIAGRMLGAVRAGVKQFEVLIRELLADKELTKDIVVGIKPRLISTWNAAKDRYGLDEATDIAFEAGMTIGVDVEQVTQGEAPATGIPISDEMARAIVGRMVGSIRSGVKKFEVFIRELRANHAEDVVMGLKPRLIRTWNGLREKHSLKDVEEATGLGFEAAMSDTKEVDIEQATEAAKSATTVTCKQCGTQNRVGEVPLGRKAVCCSCRSVLGSIESPCPPKRSAKLSVAWAWIAMLGIGLVAWIAVSSHSGRRKESTNSSALQSQSSKSYSSDYSSSSSRQIPPTPQKPASTEPEQALPPHGKITWYSNGDPIAPLEIRSSRGSHDVVKVSDYYSERAVLSVFVYGGSTINLDVPLGTYRIKYASGEHWYAPANLFGPETAYYKADSSFDFRVTGNQVSGYTLTLYKVVDGNLQTTPISPSEF